MHQCLLFSPVFLVFVFSDELVVVNSADTKDDDSNVKGDNAFSEVIKNITRVNNVLQELIKNYEKLQKIYHSQESIEQHDYDEENSSGYSKVKRSKDISTPGKSKDFPATNIPYSGVESEASPEKASADNKISKENSQDGRVPPIEEVKNENSVDKTKKRSKKETTTIAKDAKSQTKTGTTYISDEIKHERQKEKNNPTEAKEVDEHEEIRNQKQSAEQTRQNLQADQKALLDHGSEEKTNVNASEVKSEPSANADKVIPNKLILMVGEKKEGKRDAADSENEVQYEQRKRLDDNDKVFTTESKNDNEESVPKLKSRYVQKPKKPTSDASVRSPTQNKHKKSQRTSDKLTANGKNEKEKPDRKKTSQKDENSKKRNHKEAKVIPKKRTQKEDSPHDSTQKKGGSKKKNPENGGSSEDEKSIKKEQFKTSILRKAYGDACLKVVVKKCYKACKSTLKRGCRKYKCKSNFQLQFKEHSRTGCIREFREQTTTTHATTVVTFETSKRYLKTEDKLKMKARDIDKNTDGFLDLTRNGYLAAACLPKTRRTDAAPGTSAHQLNILRDRFEKECQKVSCSKCTKACTYAVDKSCSTHNCPSEKRKGLRKACSKECKDSYSASSKKKKKNKSSRSSGSGSGSGSGSSGSGSESGSDDSYSKSSKSKEKKDKDEEKEEKKTTHEFTTTTTPDSTTATSATSKKDETLRKRSDRKDESRLKLRGVEKKS